MAITNADIVYTQALAGSANNPGLPDTLAQLVAAQAQHETGNFTSDVFNHSNNGFGYKYVGSSYQTGSYKGYGTYLNLQTSTMELVDWIYRRVADGSFPADLTTITTPDAYAAYLQQASYFEDSLGNYTQGIADFFNTNILQVIQGNPGTTLLVVGGLFLAFMVLRH